MPLVLELAVLAAFLIVGLIVGTYLAKLRRRDDSDEKRRADEVHDRSSELKRSVKLARQQAWIEPWMQNGATPIERITGLDDRKPRTEGPGNRRP